MRQHTTTVWEHGTVGYLVSEGVRVSLIASQSSIEMVGKTQLKSISCCLLCVEVVQTCCLFFCS